MYYSITPEKMRNNHEQLKIERQNVTFEETSFIVCTLSNSIQGKEKQEIYVTNPNTNNEKV